MFEDLKNYAKENKVPIIKDEGLEFLLSSIQKYNVKNVLEIGTAIAYSAILMSSYTSHITTIERNKEMYDKAIENITKYNLSGKINVEFIDALDYTPSEMFDLIFIDAAKAQNKNFFLRFEPYLNKGGIVIVDNLNFHGLVNEEHIESKNLRQLVNKIKIFKEWLKDNENYQTTFTDMGDGMSLSIKL